MHACMPRSTAVMGVFGGVCGWSVRAAGWVVVAATSPSPDLRLPLHCASQHRSTPARDNDRVDDWAPCRATAVRVVRAALKVLFSTSVGGANKSCIAFAPPTLASATKKRERATFVRGATNARRARAAPPLLRSAAPDLRPDLRHARSAAATNAPADCRAHRCPSAGQTVRR